MNTNTESLRANFESWANFYFAEGLNSEWCPVDKNYDDNTVNYVWHAYQAADYAQQKIIDELRRSLSYYAYAESNPYPGAE